MMNEYKRRVDQLERKLADQWFVMFCMALMAALLIYAFIAS